MNYRLLILVTCSAFVIGACQCTPPKKGDPCEATACSTGLECDPATGKCRVIGSTGGSSGSTGGGTASNGGGTAGGGVSSNGGGASGGGSVSGGGSANGGGSGACITQSQCAAPTPACLVDAGMCVGCLSYVDCPFNTSCDTNTHTCVTGAGGGSATGGGAGTGGGSTTGGGSGTGGGSAGTGGGSGAGYCLARADAGVRCTRECTRGFSCVGGFCQLNGGTGPVQVTLRFPRAEDLDIHVREPLPDGGQCEIYYGDRGPVPDAGTMSSCGAQGWLDLDSNAACGIDNVNIENVIYDPSVSPPKGRYDVYVDYYQWCFMGTSIDYEVEVRSNGTTRYYCGNFTFSQADEGGRGSGRFITSFVVQ